MKQLFAFFLFSLLYSQLHAQGNFKPGYVVSIKGDTTKGFVDYKKWDQNPQIVLFKLAAVAQQYSPANIKGFGIDRFENYEKYTGPITTGAVNLKNLSKGIDTSFATETVFLRSVVKGKNIALYAYKDKIKTRFFISEKNGLPVELKRYVYLDTKRSDRITENNVFIQQLLDLAIKYQPDNGKLADEIKKALYRADNIENVVLTIDGSSNQLKKTTSSGNRMALFAGLSANYFKTTVAGNDDFLAESKPSQSILPGVNFGVDMSFSKNADNLIFRTEIGLSANNVRLAKTTNQADNNNGFVQDNKLSFNQFTVSLTPQLIYNVFHRSNFKAYLSGGAQLNLTNYSSFDDHLMEYLNNTLISDTHRTDAYLKTVYFGAIFKAGVVLNNLVELYAGYSTRAHLGNYNENGQSFNVDGYRVGINYLLGKKHQ
ncbi:hypothetical protein [Mucilaginibacter sp. HD30]